MNSRRVAPPVVKFSAQGSGATRFLRHRTGPGCLGSMGFGLSSREEGCGTQFDGDVEVGPMPSDRDRQAGVRACVSAVEWQSRHRYVGKGKGKAEERGNFQMRRREDVWLVWERRCTDASTQSPGSREKLAVFGWAGPHLLAGIPGDCSVFPIRVQAAENSYQDPWTPEIPRHPPGFTSQPDVPLLQPSP